jgi:hypothetical protein
LGNGWDYIGPKSNISLLKVSDKVGGEILKSRCLFILRTLEDSVRDREGRCLREKIAKGKCNMTIARKKIQSIGGLMKMNTRMFVASLMASGILTSCSFGGR